jgi:hypothetical protein
LEKENFRVRILAKVSAMFVLEKNILETSEPVFLAALIGSKDTTKSFKLLI